MDCPASPSIALFPSLTDPLRAVIAGQIRAMTGSTRPTEAFLQPVGDPGLFGPSSVTWRVHANFVGMLVGGLSSLLIQAMHPSALAGVWDHSNFRTDLKARLGRTAYFIAATTYGGRAMAGAAIEQVNTIHRRVQGITPAGVAYSAQDPHLLRWVHLGEVISFLQAYVTHGDPSLPLFAQNRYVHEMKRVGEALGTSDLPDTVAQAHAMLASYRPELRVDERVRDVVRLIENFPARWQDRPLVRLIVQAAFQALPHWVGQDLDVPPASPRAKALVRQALALVSVPMEWTLATEGVAAHARRRVEGQSPR